MLRREPKIRKSRRRKILKNRKRFRRKLSLLRKAKMLKKTRMQMKTLIPKALRLKMREAMQVHLSNLRIQKRINHLVKMMKTRRSKTTRRPNP
jgi:hypothetical protein